MTIEAAKRGYAFATVRPRGDRDPQTRTVNLVFVVEEGQRAYIERINIRGNTRTRDYVIRREFDLAEGDAYNRVLVDRAERRLKNLAYFKTVKITTEPGSAPDRVILNVDVEEQSTGEFSVAGGYSTADGLHGRGQRRRAQPARPRPVTARSRAIRPARARLRAVSFVDPYFLGYPRRARRRSVLQADAAHELRVVRDAEPRRRHAARLAAARGSRPAVALFDLSAEDRRCRRDPDELQQHQSGFREHLPDPDKVGTTGAIRRPALRTATSTAKPRWRSSSELARGPVLTSLVGYTLSTTRSTTTRTRPAAC